MQTHDSWKWAESKNTPTAFNKKKQNSLQEEDYERVCLQVSASHSAVLPLLSHATSVYENESRGIYWPTLTALQSRTAAGSRYPSLYSVPAVRASSWCWWKSRFTEHTPTPMGSSHCSRHAEAWSGWAVWKRKEEYKCVTEENNHNEEYVLLLTGFFLLFSPCNYSLNMLKGSLMFSASIKKLFSV